ncbi:PilN domain-containing protein [Patescibacteria group bacterium]
MSVNLLPTNLKPSAGIRKVAKFFRNTASLVLVLLILMIIGFGGVYFFNYTKLRDIHEKNDDLVSRIDTLEKTEESLYIMRDRIGKIQRIENNPTLEIKLDDAKDVISFVPNDIVIESVDVLVSGIKLGVSSGSSKSITNYMNNLQSSDHFKSIKMKSFNFNQISGFTAEFLIN